MCCLDLQEVDGWMDEWYRAVATAFAGSVSSAPQTLSLSLCIQSLDVLLVVALKLLCYGARDLSGMGAVPEPCAALQGKGPRGEEGALSMEEAPKDGVAIELHNAKMSQSVLLTF